MKGALRSNTCPYCAGEIMPKLKAEQYTNLLDVLEATTFTTKMEVDIQIREKVADLLVSNFVFKKLENPEKEPNLIRIDEDILVSSRTPSTLSSTPVLGVANAGLTTSPNQVLDTDMSPKASEELAKEAKRSPTEKIESIDRAPARQLKGSKKTNYKQEPQKELSMRDFLKASEETYQDDDFDSDPLDGLTPDEVKKFFPSLSTDEIVGIAGNESKGSGKGIKRL